MTWLYVHSGRSVFAAALFHAMINLCWQLFPKNGSFFDPKIFSLITVGFAIIMYAAVWFLPAAKLRTVSN